MRIINTYREPVPPSDVLSPEDILRICCKPTPVDECSEVGRLSPYEGADAEHRDFDEQAALEQARAENPGKRIIGVRAEGIGARPGQPCGEMHEKWTGALNCCDEVEPMVWDSANSVEVLADLTDGWVFVTGGTKPYHWSIRGQGMTFDGWNLRDAITDAPCIRVYAGEYACGWSPIEVTDGCSTVLGGVRSTNGAWVELGQYAIDNLGVPYNLDAMLRGYSGNLINDGYYLGVTEDGDESAISGKYWMGGGRIGGSPAPGQTGIKFRYVGVYNTRGVPFADGCLGGYAPPDPFVSVFSPRLATGCSPGTEGMFSRTVESAIAIWEWRC